MLPAHARIGKTLETLDRLMACQPPPAEILVHVAASQTEMRAALEPYAADIRLLVSDINPGPGGARNRMLQAASHELVASFDDDSYPTDPDFFACLPRCFDSLPEASILALNIHEPRDPVPQREGSPRPVPDFVGCGCAYRRSHFLEADGYVPIPIAYSMEEADLALRYAERGRQVWFAPDLRVYHDTVLSHHASPRVAAMQVANTALFAFLRYPVSRWPLGFVQICNKWIDTLRRGRVRGALFSAFWIPVQLVRYRSYRKPVDRRLVDRQRKRKRDAAR